jgi:hypothetical protein
MKIVSRCWNSVTSVKGRRSPMGLRWDCRRKTTNTTSSVWLSAIDRPRKRQGPPKLQCRWARPFVPSDNDPFAEFIVHEVAHVFHNCKRATVGLHETRTKQRSLDIDYRKRRPSGTHAKPTRARSSVESGLPSDWRWQENTAARCASRMNA